MTFEWFAFNGNPNLQTSLPLAGYLVTLALLALVVLILVRRYRDFTGLDARRVGLLVGCVVGAAALEWLLVVGLPLGAGSPESRFALLGLLPVLVAALWLGTGPATLVGLFAGLSWALVETHRLTGPFEMALLGAALAVVLNQTYRGKLAGVLRQPFVTTLAAAVVIGWPLSLMGIFLTGQEAAYANLDRTVYLLVPVLLSWLFSALIAGGVLQVVLLRWPTLHQTRESDLVAAPWEQRLSQRIIYSFLLSATLAIVLLVGVVAVTAYRVANRLVVDQMGRDASTASSQIPYFIQIGRSLIRELAQNNELTSANPADQQSALAKGIESVPFFDSFIVVDSAQTILATYPQDAGLALSAEEWRAVASVREVGVPVEVVLPPADGQAAVMSFVADGSGFVLVGRAGLDTNPILTPAVDVLREGFVGSGAGFIIDDQNTILLYPAQAGQQGQLFEPERLTEIPSTEAGTIYREREADGTRQLLYRLPISDRQGWSVVITVPNEVVLALAVQIALPTLLLTLLMMGAALPLILTVMRNITVPLEHLVEATDLITKGEMGQPLTTGGGGEIGRLSRAFEQMRLRLRERLNEQERLLSVSRSVSSSLELFRAMPPILSSALDVTNASGVRIVLRGGEGRAPQAYAAGDAAAVMATLDGQLLDLVEKQGTIVISQLWRASGSLDTADLLPHIQALVALPLRSDTSFHGVMWVGFDHEHFFEQSEMTFLSTISGQAAVAVANTRLFAEAEEGRRQLEAVLESTADGMIVVDTDGKVVLVNPAGEKYLGVRADQAQGHPAKGVISNSELARLLTDLQEPVGVMELPQQGGKTLLANISTIVSHDGVITGRVAVLRDITALKELDNLKTVFLRMVSHDLRSPLTYMRGYASMLPLSGTINERQQEALGRINDGINHISQMTERLTYLSRLQFGEEAELEMVYLDVKELVEEEIARHTELAQQKNITIDAQIEEKLPLLFADGMLYAHAVTNLIHNALKYTPEGGTVAIRAFKEGDDHIAVTVHDDGIGIREEDQAQLFEAFYRVPQREDDPPRPKGSGLGLALVKAIADSHNGSVSVTSEYGKGSTFAITLPVEREK